MSETPTTFTADDVLTVTVDSAADGLRQPDSAVVPTMPDVPNTTRLTLTPKQVRAIYDAGIKRGEDSATAYEWGHSPDGDKFDELEAVILWDGDLKGVVPDDYDEKKAWWAAYLVELRR